MPFIFPIALSYFPSFFIFLVLVPFLFVLFFERG